MNKRRFTDEYLELERKADHKSEYYAGEIYAMSGGTEYHSLLSVRIIVTLSRLLLDSCKVYDSNLKVFLQDVRHCVYPDAMVLCGETEFWDQRKDVILNPTLVVEVLSPSTETYDKGIKATYYRNVPLVAPLPVDLPGSAVR